jgi:hypothetical protein
MRAWVMFNPAYLQIERGEQDSRRSGDGLELKDDLATLDKI